MAFLFSFFVLIYVEFEFSDDPKGNQAPYGDYQGPYDYQGTKSTEETSSLHVNSHCSKDDTECLLNSLSVLILDSTRMQLTSVRRAQTDLSTPGPLIIVGSLIISAGSLISRRVKQMDP